MNQSPPPTRQYLLPTEDASRFTFKGRLESGMQLGRDAGKCHVGFAVRRWDLAPIYQSVLLDAKFGWIELEQENI